ncbi:MAG: MFS transporter [Alphaproteobacteria bacterium]
MSTAAEASKPSLKRLAGASAIGNVLEWYDFAVYGFFAPIIAAQFFPSDDPVFSLIASFGAFAAGFFMRPVGAALFGYVGDRFGRSKALFYSVMMMAVPTGLIAILPTAESWGVAAAVLMVMLRMAQGLAVGGEYTSSVVYLAEHSPAKRRALFSAFPLNGANVGILLASAIGAALSSMLSTEALHEWGWRAAFGFGILVAIVGLFLRRGLHDTPADLPEKSPVIVAFRDHWRGILRGFGLIVGYAAGYYMIFVYLVTWLVGTVKEPESTALDINTIAIASMLVLIPISAWLSDRFGRRLMLVIGYGGMVLFAYPLIWLMHHPDATLILLGQLGFAALISTFAASIPSTLVEMFPREIRVTAVGLSYNLTFALFGGTAPMVAVWLISRTHNDHAFVWYIIGLAAISFLVALTVKDRHGEELEG